MRHKVKETHKYSKTTMFCQDTVNTPRLLLDIYFQLTVFDNRYVLYNVVMSILLHVSAKHWPSSGKHIYKGILYITILHIIIKYINCVNGGICHQIPIYWLLKLFKSYLMLTFIVIKINYGKLRSFYMRHVGKETMKYCKITMLRKSDTPIKFHTVHNDRSKQRNKTWHLSRLQSYYEMQHHVV